MLTSVSAVSRLGTPGTMIPFGEQTRKEKETIALLESSLLKQARLKRRTIWKVWNELWRRSRNEIGIPLYMLGEGAEIEPTRLGYACPKIVKRILQEDDVFFKNTSSNRAAIFVSTSREERHNKRWTNLFGYKLGESTENNNAVLFLSGKETIQTFNGSI